MSEESMDYGFSGESNKWDCSEVDSNSVSGFEGEGFSVTAESGTTILVDPLTHWPTNLADPLTLTIHQPC